MSEGSGAVFLSYASQDAEAAESICEALRAAGIEVWLDQSELRGGETWDAAIRKQIKACALFIPLISTRTTARVEGYFRLEWKLAVDRSHLIAAERAFILPVVIDETLDAAALVPDKFREVQWTRCPAGKPPGKFIDRVVGLLASETRPASAATFQANANGPTNLRQPIFRRRGVSAAIVGAALLVLGAGAAYQLSLRSSTIGMIAVLPFENATGDPANEYLSDGISDSLINRISSLRGLHVISRTSAFAFKGKKLDPTVIGKKLGVDALVLGSLSQHGGNLNVSTELVRVKDATQLWGDHYARPIDDMIQMEGEIATTIAQTLRRKLSGDEKMRLTQNDTSNPEAYRLYLKGREFLVGTDPEMDKSVDYFQQAVARAPDYALAYAGLADVYTIQAYLRASGRAEAVDKARAAVNRALELDPDLGEAHTALGLVRNIFDWDWAGADAEFRRGIALSPGSEIVHEEYGSFLIEQLRLDEGLAQSREAARLDPLSVQPFHDMAINALVRGDFEQAAAGFQHTIAIDPDWTWGYIKLGRALALAKKCKSAFAQAEIAERKIAGGAGVLSRSWLGATYAACGDATRARQKLDELNALAAKQYVDPVAFADIYATLNEMDEAFRWYDKALLDRSPNLVSALAASRVVPQLAANPRYQEILRRMAFPQSTNTK